MGSPQSVETDREDSIDQPPTSAAKIPEPHQAEPEARTTGSPWILDLYLAALLVATFLIDQVSKQLVRDNIFIGGSVPSEGFLRITHTTNTGSAFGFFPNQTIVLALASLAGIAILIIFYRRQSLPGMWIRTSLGLQLGGAAGNLADRITLGGVTDFIDVGPWPVFNLADSAIVVGIGILAWVLFSAPRQPPSDDQIAPPDEAAGQEQPPESGGSIDEPLSLVYERPAPDALEERLDVYIARVQPALTRSQVQRLIRQEQVRVNGTVARASLRLRPGDHVEVLLPPPPPSRPAPEEIPIDVLYRDADVLIVDKPPGLSVHPAPGRPSGTLVNALLARYPDLEDTGDRLRPGIVHRLDADTSGMMVVARTEAAFRDLSRQIKERSVTKLYLALVLGHPDPPQGVIEAPIGRDPRNRRRMAVVEDGRQATTRYQVLRRLDGYALLEVTPHTGRTHQIRVHLSSIGHPVAGDRLYGGRVPFLRRQFLHAARLGFRLPSSGEYTEFASELPPDLREALAGLEASP